MYNIIILISNAVIIIIIIRSTTNCCVRLPRGKTRKMERVTPRKFLAKMFKLKTHTHKHTDKIRKFKSGLVNYYLILSTSGQKSKLNRRYVVGNQVSTYLLFNIPGIINLYESILPVQQYYYCIQVIILYIPNQLRYPTSMSTLSEFKMMRAR